MKKSILLGLAILPLTNLSTHATESGMGHYIPGALGTLIDTPPNKPGLALELQYNLFNGSMTNGDQISIGRNLVGGVDVIANSAVAIAVYTIEPTILGAHYSAGVFVPFSDIQVKGKLQIGPITRSKKDTATGIGDIAFAPVILNWTAGNTQYFFLFPIYTPTGSYSKSDIANLGMNYWTFEPTAGITYLHPETLIGATVFAALDFNTENTDMDYQSGRLFHTDASVFKEWMYGAQTMWGIGAAVSWIQQISDDSGDGAVLGDFHQRTTAVGPFINLSHFTKDSALSMEIKYLRQIDSSNTIEGDIVWVKFAYLF